jgi:hypothetical protein
MKNKLLILVVLVVFGGFFVFKLIKNSKDDFFKETVLTSPLKQGLRNPIKDKIEVIKKPLVAEKKSSVNSWSRNEPTEEEFFESFNEAIINGDVVIDDFGGNGDFGKKVHSDNPQTTISTSDLPPELANKLNEEVNFKKKHGYERVSDDDVYKEKNAMFDLSGTERNIPYLSFELTKIPEVLEAYYEYQGYIYPKSMTTTPSYMSVRRVYKNKAGLDYIVIDEETLVHGDSYVLSEFVNSSVEGCPAIIGEKRAMSGDGYGAINWSNKNYSYTIMRLFVANNRTQGLLELATQLALANKSTHICEESNANGEELDDKAI